MHFQCVGKQPVPIERLNNFVRLGVMDEMVDLSIIADTPSRPVDLPGLGSSVGLLPGLLYTG